MSGAEGEAENICSYNRQVTIGADRDPTPIDFFDCLYGVTAGTGSDLTLCRFTVMVPIHSKWHQHQELMQRAA